MENKAAAVIAILVAVALCSSVAVIIVNDNDKENGVAGTWYLVEKHTGDSAGNIERSSYKISEKTSPIVITSANDNFLHGTYCGIPIIGTVDGTDIAFRLNYGGDTIIFEGELTEGNLLFTVLEYDDSSYSASSEIYMRNSGTSEKASWPTIKSLTGTMTATDAYSFVDGVGTDRLDRNYKMTIRSQDNEIAYFDSVSSTDEFHFVGVMKGTGGATHGLNVTIFDGKVLIDRTVFARDRLVATSETFVDEPSIWRVVYSGVSPEPDMPDVLKNVYKGKDTYIVGTDGKAVEYDLTLTFSDIFRNAATANTVFGENTSNWAVSCGTSPYQHILHISTEYTIDGDVYHGNYIGYMSLDLKNITVKGCSLAEDGTQLILSMNLSLAE